MKKAVLTGAVLAATLSCTAAQACVAGSAQEINGNWYCQAVNAISYTNFGTPGTYDKVVSMANGQCSSQPQAYGGGIAPLDEEVSWHFRGPLNLKQFAFYSPGTGAAKRDIKPTPMERRHGHQHQQFHKKRALEVHENHITEEKRAVEEKRDCTPAMITATIDGDVVSWPNPYCSATQPPAVPTGAPALVAPISVPSAIPSMNAGAGMWGRQAYYNADQGVADGLVFLNNMGGQGSGVFDYTWGMSLSYASSDATKGSATPVTLADNMLGDNVEVIIMSDQICNGDCGTVRPGSVAYHGFDGPSKVFLLEFSMPLTGKTGFNMDMPAAWILNAQIPRTMQYGQADCSCWESGCGEWDIFEILDSGNARAKSTFHGSPSGGDSNYFQRPIDGTIKAAVIFDGPASAGHIVLLPNTTTFDTTLASSIVSGFVNSIAGSSWNAVFNLAQ